jgi:hypothetical protein
MVGKNKKRAERKEPMGVFTISTAPFDFNKY